MRLAFPDAQLSVALAFLLCAAPLSAEPLSSVAMDAATGRIISADDATVTIHPGRLTQMMTLYVASAAIAAGEVSRDELVAVSAAAASQNPVILGLEEGERVPLGVLIDTVAVHGARDAALAIAEAVAGSEAAFVRRMNHTALAMCMPATIFLNATGTNMTGHHSSAADLAVLARHVIHDYPGLLATFAQNSIGFRGRQLNSNLRRLRVEDSRVDELLSALSPAGGFSIAATASSGGRRVIAVVIGDASAAQRNTAALELMHDALSLIPPDGGGVLPDLTGCAFARLRDSTSSGS